MTATDKNNPDDMLKIAFVNFGGIGDEVLFTPVINEVHQHLPKAHLTLIVEDRAGNIKHLLPHVNSVIDLTVQGVPRPLLFFKLWTILRSKYFDAVISSGSSPFIPLLLFLSGIPHRVGFRTGKISQWLLTAEAPLDKKAYAADMYFKLARTFLTGFLPKEAHYNPPLHVAPQLAQVPAEEEQWATKLLDEHADDPALKKILIHPGVSLVSIKKKILKGWPAKNWAALIKKLADTHQVYLVGGPDDKAIVDEIRTLLPAELYGYADLYGKTKSLLQLAALIQQADLLISVDSAPMHFAVGYNTPIVAMFGPTDPAKLLPETATSKAVHVDALACRPCLWDTRAVSCDRPICLDVPLSKMLKAVAEVLGSSHHEESEEVPEDTPS